MSPGFVMRDIVPFSPEAVWLAVLVMVLPCLNALGATYYRSIWLHFFILGNVQLKKLIEVGCDCLGYAASGAKYGNFVVANCGS